jgi:hypothetical protein
MVIEDRLAAEDPYVLNATELVLVHQFHQRPLPRAQILSPQVRSERWGGF